uniref:Uncharacterized protein n=1 Tax=Arundo donax TaxID=35708 RepID=A0A0A9E3J4_ARUDO
MRPATARRRKRGGGRGRAGAEPLMSGSLLNSFLLAFLARSPLPCRASVFVTWAMH